jgi:hypothetical protein
MNLTIVISRRCSAHSKEVDGWTEPRRRDRILSGMVKPDATHELSWPWWAPWALLAVALTSLLTVGATLYDIL